MYGSMWLGVLLNNGMPIIGPRMRDMAAAD